MFKGSGGGNGSRGDLNGFLDAGSHINGELRFEDTFRIDGKLTGSIVSDGDLVIGEKGEVDGEVNVQRVFVSGTVRGQLYAGQRLEITSTGRVLADIASPSLAIEEGAFLEGRCSMKVPDKADSEKPSGKREASDKVTPMPLPKKSGKAS